MHPTRRTEQRQLKTKRIGNISKVNGRVEQGQEVRGGQG